MNSSATTRVHLSLPVTMVLCLLTGVLTSLRASRDPAAQESSPEPRVIEVAAKNYAFEPSTIEVAQGERVRLLVKSGDDLHGFEIKRFKVSKEIPRGGDPVVIEFTADAAGRFPILCSVYCGDGHDGMQGVLVVTARASAQP